MLLTFSYWIIMLFGCFFIGVGFLMLFAPEKANAILRKAGSTNLINYGELLIRIVPATAMVIYAQYSKFPVILSIFGGFMIVTSIVLLMIPKKLHNQFSVKSADILKPIYFRLISPISGFIGGLLIYTVL